MVKTLEYLKSKREYLITILGKENKITTYGLQHIICLRKTKTCVQIQFENGSKQWLKTCNKVEILEEL